MKHSDYLNYQKLVAAGYSQREACVSVGVPRSTMQDYIRRLGGEEDTLPVILGPKVLYVDIESAPDLSVGFSRYNANFGQDNIIAEGGYFLCAAWKWHGDDNVFTAEISNPEERWYGSDIEVVAALYEAINQADWVVAHNGLRFDIPMLKARLAFHGMPPLSTVKVIDTLRIAKQFRFNSNKLDSLGAYLGLGRKNQHSGIKLWVDVMRGDPDAMEEMLEYNIQDVHLLEQVYHKLRAFDATHPNASHYHPDDAMRCAVCGSTDVAPTGKSVYTAVSQFKEVRCNGCGHVHRRREALNSKEKRKNILVSPPLRG